MNNSSSAGQKLAFQSSPTERYVVSVITSLITWPMTCLYVVIIYVMCKNRNLRSNSFFILAINLGVADVIQMVTILLHGVFITSMGDPWGVPDGFNFFHATLLVVSFYTQLMLMNIIAVNRYVALCWYHKYKVWFTIKITIYLCVLSWLLPIAFYIWRVSIGVTTVYHIYSWSYDVIFPSAWKVTNDTVVIVGIAFPALLYLVLVAQYKKIQSSLVAVLNNSDIEEQRKRAEKILMIQFSIIIAVFFFYEILWQFVFKMFDVKVCFIILNFLNILNCTINPIMYLSFGSELRKYISFTVQAR